METNTLTAHYLDNPSVMDSADVGTVSFTPRADGTVVVGEHASDFDTDGIETTEAARTLYRNLLNSGWTKR